MELIEREVEAEDVDAGIAEDTQIRPFGVLPDKCAHLIERNAARFCHARDLQLGIARTDVRVEAAARGSYGIGGHGIVRAQAIFRAIGGDTILYCVGKLLGSRAEIAPLEAAAS